MNYQEQIDRFLSNKMSAEERHSFEQLMLENPDLLREVEEARFAVQKLKEMERLSLKKRLQDIENQIEENKNTKKANPIIWILVLIIVCGLGLLFWYMNQKNTPIPSVPLEVEAEPDSNVNIQNIEIIPVDTIIKVPPIQNETKQEKTLPREKREEIYAAHFEPYTDDDIEYEVRSLQEKSPFELYKHYYINGKYDQVLATFEDLDPNLKMDHQVLLIKANVLMAQKKFSPALMILRSLEKDIHSPIFKDVQWYLALCYIQVGQFEKAKAILNNPALADPSKSKKLLDKL